MQGPGLAGLLCLGVLLAGCSQFPQDSSESPDWQARVTQLSALKHWNASGKIAIRTQQQSTSANLDWQQNEDISHIYLRGPIGLGATAIESDRKTLSISRDGTTRHYDIASSEAISGWDLPLQALPYWVTGLPAPDSPEQSKLIENALLRELQQLGWTIRYSSYGLFEHHQLPTKMTIEREGTRAKLILRRWKDLSS